MIDKNNSQHVIELQKVWDTVADKLQSSGFKGVAFKVLSNPYTSALVEVSGTLEVAKSVMRDSFRDRLRNIVRSVMMSTSPLMTKPTSSPDWPPFELQLSKELAAIETAENVQQVVDDTSGFRGFEDTAKKVSPLGDEYRTTNTNSLPDPDGFFKIAQNIAMLVTEKNQVYGNAFGTAGDALRLLYPYGVTPEHYSDMLALVRIWDKMMRIATAKDAFGENPVKDIAGYALLMLGQNSD